MPAYILDGFRERHFEAWMYRFTGTGIGKYFITGSREVNRHRWKYGWSCTKELG